MNNLYKVVLLGESGVGKTALLDRFVNRRFTNHYKSTIGADFLTQELEIENKLVTLQIWDTAGCERFNSLGKVFYRGADCCILVVDITRMKTLKALDFWRNEFLLHAEVGDEPKFPFLVIGNRLDLENERQISRDDVVMWCQKNKVPQYIETSAKTGQNVETAFRLAATEVLKLRSEQQKPVFYPKSSGNEVDLSAQPVYREETQCCL